MSSSETSDPASVVSSDGDIVIINNIDELKDFVIVSPGCYPNYHVANHSTRSSSASAIDQTEMVEYSRVNHKLLEKGREYVVAVETCRYHLRFSSCGTICNGPTKCDDCVSLIAGLETLANCAHEWPNDSKPFRENVSNILHRLHRLPYRFQSGLYSVIGVVIGNIDDWPVVDRESFKLWGFKVSAVLWLLRIGVHGLALALQEGKEWRLLLAEAEHAWYQERVVAEEYEDAVEDIQRLASVFRKWGVNVGAQRRAQPLA